MSRVVVSVWKPLARATAIGVCGGVNRFNPVKRTDRVLLSVRCTRRSAGNTCKLLESAANGINSSQSIVALHRSLSIEIGSLFSAVVRAIINYYRAITRGLSGGKIQDRSESFGPSSRNVIRMTEFPNVIDLHGTCN